VAAARDPMYYPEQLVDGITEQRAHNVYFFATDNPNYYVDITQTIDRKIEALLAHSSQIGSREIAETVKARARVVGAEIGVEFAEAFH